MSGAKPLNIYAFIEDDPAIYYKRDCSGTMLSYYLDGLKDGNRARFSLMGQDLRNDTRVRLINTLLTLRMDAELQIVRKQKNLLLRDCEALQVCLSQLHELDELDAEAKNEFFPKRENPLGYLGLYAHLDLSTKPCDPNDTEQLKKLIKDAEQFVKKIYELDPSDNDETNKTRQFLGQFNDWRRMHWVAGVSMMQATVDLVWDVHQYRFEYISQFDEGVKVLTWPMGFISIFLYLFRFGVEFWDALKQAVNKSAPIESNYVKLAEQTGASRLAQDIFGMRKYILLNDLLWAIVNTLCFLWLNGSMITPVGFAGNLLTLIFLCVDCALTIARYLESKKVYEDELARLDGHVADIDYELSNKNTQDENERNQLIYLKKTRAQLLEARAKLQHQWRYQQYKLWVELGYTVSLILAFGLMCALFMTGIGGALVMGVIGAAAWFILNLIFNGVNAALDVSKVEAEAKVKEAAALDYIKAFNSASSEDEKRHLYLLIKEQLARGQFDQKQIRFLRTEIALNTVAHALAPVVVFTALAFLPLGVGVPIIGVFLALLYFNKRMIASMKPKPENARFFPSFDANSPFGDRYETEFQTVKAQSGLVLQDFGKLGKGMAAASSG